MSLKTLIELGELVIQSNYFEFTEQYLKQIGDAAIGNKFATPYALIYIEILKEDFLKILIKKSWVWWRYINDIFMIWQHGEDEMKMFSEKFNNFFPHIKFTWGYSRVKNNYLDAQVFIREGKSINDLDIKQTNSHQYPDTPSCQPYHWLNQCLTVKQ